MKRGPLTVNDAQALPRKYEPNRPDGGAVKMRFWTDHTPHTLVRLTLNWTTQIQRYQKSSWTIKVYYGAFLVLIICIMLKTVIYPFNLPLAVLILAYQLIDCKWASIRNCSLWL